MNKVLSGMEQTLRRLKHLSSSGALVHYSDEYDGKMRDYDITLDREIESLEQAIESMKQVLKEAT